MLYLTRTKKSLFYIWEYSNRENSIEYMVRAHKSEKFLSGARKNFRITRSLTFGFVKLYHVMTVNAYHFYQATEAQTQARNPQSHVDLLVRNVDTIRWISATIGAATKAFSKPPQYSPS